MFSEMIKKRKTLTVICIIHITVVLSLVLLLLQLIHLLSSKLAFLGCALHRKLKYMNIY